MQPVDTGTGPTGQGARAVGRSEGSRRGLLVLFHVNIVTFAVTWECKQGKEKPACSGRGGKGGGVFPNFVKENSTKKQLFLDKKRLF